MIRFSMFESLESRMFLSASPLAAAEGLLASATSQLSADKSTSASVIAADTATLAEVENTPLNLGPLQATLKRDKLARSTTLSDDREELKQAISNDQSFIHLVRNDIRKDKAEKNNAQLRIDRAQLATDQMTLQTDRSTLTAALDSDTTTTAATISNDNLAITNAIGARKTTLADDKQTLRTDEKTWAETLATDRKTIKADQLAVIELG